MRTSWLVGALVCFVIGLVLTLTLVGAVVGIPLIVLSLILLFLGIIIPSEKSHVHVNQVQNVHVSSRPKKK